MVSNPELIAQIDGLFHPKSIAIVGVPRGLKTGKLFLLALLDQGYPGKIYPVNPQAAEIDGIKAYPSVSAIPDPIDLAIILVTREHTLSVIRECAAKGVKGAVLFTSGYKENGTDEGKALEDEIVRVARASDMRLIGPNGMGLYSPKTKIGFFPQLSKVEGPIGIISHSGSLTNILGIMAPQKAIRFSKVVSLGNECDLTSADFLKYLGQDADTRVIGAYIEGIKQGDYFFDALQKACLSKPVILWKVGLTPEGAMAATSHTGALAGSLKIWEGIVRQTGAVSVFGFEAWVDALMGFSLLPADIGNRMAIISGPGGLAVSAAEACGKQGLALAQLTDKTRRHMTDFVPPTGTSLRNPIDVGLTASLDIDIYIKTARTVASDPNVDTVVMVGIGLTPEANEHYTQSIIEIRDELQKPFIMVNIPGFDSQLAQKFCENGIPFFESAERAMQTYAQIHRYQCWKNKRI